MKCRPTIRVAKTKALIRLGWPTAKLVCVFVFAYAGCCHETAQMSRVSQAEKR